MQNPSIRIVRAFVAGPSSIVVTIPRAFGVEAGTELIATKDQSGKITYEPLTPESVAALKGGSEKN